MLTEDNKKEKVEKNDESEKEFDLDEVELNIDNPKFVEFFEPIEFSPVLDKVTVMPEAISHLEIELAEVFRKGVSDSKHYKNVNYNEDKEKSYIENQSQKEFQFNQGLKDDYTIQTLDRDFQGFKTRDSLQKKVKRSYEF